MVKITKKASLELSEKQHDVVEKYVPWILTEYAELRELLDLSPLSTRTDNDSTIYNLDLIVLSLDSFLSGYDIDDDVLWHRIHDLSHIASGTRTMYYGKHRPAISISGYQAPLMVNDNNGLLELSVGDKDIYILSSESQDHHTILSINIRSHPGLQFHISNPDYSNLTISGARYIRDVNWGVLLTSHALAHDMVSDAPPERLCVPARTKLGYVTSISDTFF